MRVSLIFRNIAAGFSIHKVFIDFKGNENVKMIKSTVNYHRANIKSIIGNLNFVFALRKTADVFHITGDIHYCILALLGRKKILTIHDTVLLDRTSKGIKYLFFWLFWFYLPCKFADHVVCISQTTKNTLLKHVIPKSYSVIYDPISIIFKRNFKEFNQIKPVILHIGTNWNKNLAGVIIALRDISCTLRIIGKIEQKDIALLQENGINWSQAENLSDQEILEEYINCDMVSFPSIYEGFGMPIIEGQAVGRVVLTSKIDPMPEIGGADSAYYVNPADVNEIRNGFLCLINDAALRERLVENGFENSKRFSLDIILQEYMDIYNRYSDHS